MKLLLCLLLLLAAIAAVASTPATRTTSHSSYADYSVIGKPTITAQHMNNLLCSSGSPACGTGQQLYDDGLQSGIDPIFALAFFHHESTYGTEGVARLTLSLGNIRCSPGYQCLDGFRAYGSWEAGYSDWYRLIRYYTDTLGKRTIPDIVPTYAPSSENDGQGYITAIDQDVNQWRNEAQS